MNPDSSDETNLEEFSGLGSKGRFRRRVFRRPRLNKPMFDGDGDGFMTDPLTGEDNVPAPRVKPQPARRVVLPRSTDRMMSRLQTPFASRNVSDDEDPLEEMNRRLGISKPSGRNPWTDLAKRPMGEERQNARDFSPVEVSRKRVAIEKFSGNQFLRLMDDLVDYARENAADLEERENKRVWKLLFVMQKINQLDGLARSGDGIALNISEDELKRLYKGLQTMTDGPWYDDEDASDLFAKIKKLYNKSWDSIAEAKFLITDFEVKALGRTIGRRARSAVRRVFSRIDGDGDGFRTNPATGRDDLPVTDAPDVPKPGKPLSVTDVGLMSMRTRGRNLAKVRENALKRNSWRGIQKMYSDTNSSFLSLLFGPQRRTKEEAFDVLKASIDGSRSIKDRDWAVFEKRVNKIESDLKDKYGELETLSDFDRAFKQVEKDIYAARGVSVAFRANSFSEFEDQDRGFLKGVLHMLTNFPDRYEETSRIKIKKAPPPPKAENASAYAGFEKPWAPNPNPSSLPRVFAKGRLSFVMVDGIPSHYDTRISAIGFEDGISQQIMKSFLKANEGTNPDKGSLVKRLDELSGLATGVHEGTHGLHYLSAIADLFPDGVDAKELEQMLNEMLTDKSDLVFQRYGVMEASDAIVRYSIARNALIGYPGDDYFIDIINDPNTDDLGRFEATRLLNKARGLQDFKNDFEAYVLQSQDPKAQDALSVINNYQEWGHPGRVQEMLKEIILDKPESFSQVGHLASALDKGIDLDQVRPDFENTQYAQMTALEILYGEKLWDDLTDGEKAELRKIWKYVSRYARDRNSVYDGQHNVVSVEGMAEAMALRVFGFDLPLDKVSPEAVQALNKWLFWVSGGTK